MSPVCLDVKTAGLVQNAQRNAVLPFETVPNAMILNMNQFVNVVLNPGI